jgi:HEAT repeat protein
VRVLAVRAAARCGWLSDARARVALSDQDPSVRREVLVQIARVRPLGFERDVAGALQDADPLVCEAAAHALGEMQAVGALDEIIEVARTHDDPRCREAAIAALGMLGDDRGRQTLIDSLNDKPNVRRRAIVALSNFEGPDVEAALEAAREDRDWQVRAAVDLLGRDPDAS